MDTAKLPSPLATVTGSLTHQPEFAADAAVGLYEFGTTTVTVFGLGSSDCDRFSNKTCPYFERTRITADGKISTGKWAYFPVQKKWVALDGSKTIKPIDFPASVSTFDGASWSEGRTFAPNAQSQSDGPWSYGYGNIEYQLNLTASTLAGQIISGTTTYPSDAVSITLSFEQKAGVLYTLAKGGDRGGSDDGKQYSNVAALRAAHTTTSTPLCLSKFIASALIYFDSNVHAAGVAYGSGGACQATIGDRDKITAVRSGVITLADRPVIAVQIPSNLFNNNVSDREKQVLGIIGLDAAVGGPTDGYSANGMAYLPGYTRTYAGYKNKAAFEAWLSTVTTDPEAQTQP